ncbi:hypothetical protein CGLO_05688 [Colletotrichum gloeosporioides Cg-14]|uniref:Uncharacterized protein n=1 Tax=Colletotrichum gloeosporioides (strain Cg-14) TaxID=1237896 RepID=T0KGE3_COLGC|nr:hypothetical protein CGLO_05688 [Colletotrichum gloeosporioides Cg-14]
MGECFVSPDAWDGHLIDSTDHEGDDEEQKEEKAGDWDWDLRRG